MITLVKLGDLSFKANDVIKVHTDDGEWWEGSCKGQEGLFPANYVKKKEIEVKCVPTVFLLDNTVQTCIKGTV